VLWVEMVGGDRGPLRGWPGRHQEKMIKSWLGVWVPVEWGRREIEREEGYVTFRIAPGMGKTRKSWKQWSVSHGRDERLRIWEKKWRWVLTDIILKIVGSVNHMCEE